MPKPLKFPYTGAFAVVSISAAIFIGLLHKYCLGPAILGTLGLIFAGEMAVLVYWLHRRVDLAEWDHHHLKTHNPKLYKARLPKACWQEHHQKGGRGAPPSSTEPVSAGPKGGMPPGPKGG